MLIISRIHLGAFLSRIKDFLASPALLYQQAGLGVLAVLLCLGYTENAYANFAVLCTTFNTAGGAIVSAVSTIGVVTLGAGAALGRVSWGTAVMVAIGITVMNGFGTIINDLGGAYC